MKRTESSIANATDLALVARGLLHDSPAFHDKQRKSQRGKTGGVTIIFATRRASGRRGEATLVPFCTIFQQAAKTTFAYPRH